MAHLAERARWAGRKRSICDSAQGRFQGLETSPGPRSWSPQAQPVRGAEFERPRWSETLWALRSGHGLKGETFGPFCPEGHSGLSPFAAPLTGSPGARAGPCERPLPVAACWGYTCSWVEGLGLLESGSPAAGPPTPHPEPPSSSPFWTTPCLSKQDSRNHSPAPKPGPAPREGQQCDCPQELP